MSRKELDRDLEAYLAHRKQREKKVKVEEVRMPPEVETYDDEKPKHSWLAWLFGYDEEKKPAVQEPIPEKEFDETAIKQMVDVEQLKNDLREIARFSLAYFKDLPHDKLEKLKASPEFEKFKEVLRRHGVIK
ncbi:MAG: hypothetical protein HY363_03895 [Candidatus Aenigmarchaeota archaeon]|nr:hypothetical protein [Candidatus Aenigmarchaeota archaeon]